MSRSRTGSSFTLDARSRHAAWRWTSDSGAASLGGASCKSIRA
eukprot:CAMPEP_0119075516 /NCGR_PEP_ID=MMETSP1178-20130426/81109_1 /TAXON_ID=33656 /ORGANISM="unid sp, Strain CCMP2000" /LENGTH=42 /DNA_ID= /DNA_START= /DNA_END= /DNA_ORIENTATION=